MSSETTNILAETADRLMADQVSRVLLEKAEEGLWSGDLWQALTENGLTQPLAPEERGGLGATWADAFVIAFAAGLHRAPVPLVETMAAGWLLGIAGLDVPGGPISLVDDGSGVEFDHVTLSGVASAVPWARNADYLVVVAGGNVVLIDAASVTVAEDANLANDPRDTVTLNKVTPLASGRLPVDTDLLIVRVIGAAMRAAQMAGAMERAIGLAVTHAQDREQFGRPIAKFQAIQQMLAVAAARAAEARVAAEVAFSSLGNNEFTEGGGISDGTIRDVAAAKIVTGEAAGIVYDTVHQVHGAIGFTYEHELHFTTRRLWAWRGEFGAENIWAEYLGRKVLSNGADAIWPNLTAEQV